MAALQRSWLSSLKSTALFPPANHHKNSLFKLSFSQSQNDEASKSNSPNSEETAPVDPIKLAFERAKAYKKTTVNPGGGDGKNTDGVKFAVEKASEYKENGSESTIASVKKTGSEDTPQQRKILETKIQKQEKLSVSSIDFVGLDFADKKKSRGLPPGLQLGEATTPEMKQNTEEDSEVYKPKVSTWGVFPRPGNISKTFGGGRTIRPGEVLETEEDRNAKNERTRQLLAAYKKKVGLNVDPKLISECDKALKDGDSLMDSGKLKEALSYYERVMEKMPFKSELHGVAAVQWSICQDSLSRPKEAQVMYEKLQSHPNPKVSKKASQFLYSFKAMEMMKVTGSNFSLNHTGYQNFFEAFIEDKANYNVQGSGITEGALNQALPYMIFLLSPIIVVLFIAVQKGYAN
ncbi:receptor protein kinase CLAVATA1-like [Hibiscus syriacus]|uniref:Receptor protein kinase CLAVATA1-like n=1 Tax=Hibiscus syriacus TaxID=106335 RepID=A0A6A2ZU69_HIBSY|nr:receptor protein kinase CLAVATA1-like [Hibiscus syriacus]